MLDLKARETNSARVEQIGNGWRMNVPAGGRTKYRVAQLDDYAHLMRRQFSARPPLTLSLQARASAEFLPGTWGFGLWNDPYGVALWMKNGPFRPPVLPNALWFFHAAPPNHLSFRDDKPGYGFLAQSFRAPAFSPLLIPAGLALPFARKTTRRLLSRAVEEDGVRLEVDVTQWHGYRLEWSPKRVVFEVDDEIVLETSVAPRPPLGLVIWIDNQFAAFTPQGKLAFGLVDNPEMWLEIKDLEIKQERPSEPPLQEGYIGGQ